MRVAAKVGVVLGGYVLAIVVAWVVTTLYVVATSGPDRQTYGAMYAFGDSILFLMVFGLAACLPTAAALFFLRPVPTFWVVLSTGALAVSTTGLAAAPLYFMQGSPVAGPVIHGFGALAVLRVLIAPICASTFLLCALFAPNPRSRRALALALGMEMAGFVPVAAVWFVPLVFRSAGA